MTQFTIPEGSGEAILGYVRRKSLEWTAAQMVERVEDALGVLERAMAAVPHGDLERVAPGEEWAPLFCMLHVAEINIATASRCAGVAKSGLLPAGPPSPLGADRPGLMAGQRRALERAFADIRAAGEVTHAGLTWTHPLLGELNWREWFLTLRVHCLAHAAQLEALRAALGQAGAG